MIRRVVVALAVAITIASCGKATEAPGDEAAAAIDFRAETVGGGKIDMADYAGEPLALWFWSPW